MKTFLKYNWGALLWAFFIVLLLFLPAKTFENLDAFTGYDFLAHANVFFVLVILMLYGQSKQYGFQNVNFKALLLLCVGFCILFGVFTEMVQGVFIRSRSMDIWDVVADALGTLAGAALFSLYFRFRKNSTQP